MRFQISAGFAGLWEESESRRTVCLDNKLFNPLPVEARWSTSSENESDGNLGSKPNRTVSTPVCCSVIPRERKAFMPTKFREDHNLEMSENSIVKFD